MTLKQIASMGKELAKFLMLFSCKRTRPPLEISSASTWFWV